MTPRKLVGLTAVVLVLFAFILLFERKIPTTSERQERGDLVWDVPEDRIDEIVLQRGDSRVDLKKTAGTWRLVKPEPYPADSAAVSDLVGQLARLKRVGGDSAEARPEDYGFKSPSARASLTARGEDGKKLTRSVEFGLDIPGTDTTAARVEGQNAVLFVASSAANAARKSADELKSKDVFGTALDVARLEVERGRGRLTLSKKEGIWWLDQPFADLADADAVQRLVGELTGLRVLDFVSAADRQNLAAFGLAPPLYRVLVTDAKGASTTVEFGSTRSDGNSVYARRENQVFTVPSTTVEDLSKEAVAFREPRLVRFERSAAVEADGVFSSANVVLTRKDSGWTAAGHAIPAAGADDVLTAISDLKSRSFLDEGGAAGSRAGQPAGTVTMRLSSGGPWTVKLFRRGADTEATVSGRPGAFLISGDVLPALEQAFRKAMASTVPTPAPTKAPTKAVKR